MKVETNKGRTSVFLNQNQEVASTTIDVVGLTKMVGQHGGTVCDPFVSMTLLDGNDKIQTFMTIERAKLMVACLERAIMTAEGYDVPSEEECEELEREYCKRYGL